MPPKTLLSKLVVIIDHIKLIVFSLSVFFFNSCAIYTYIHLSRQCICTVDIPKMEIYIPVCSLCRVNVNYIATHECTYVVDRNPKVGVGARSM